MNPEELQGLIGQEGQSPEGAPTEEQPMGGEPGEMTEEQYAQQEEQDNQIMQGGYDPESVEMMAPPEPLDILPEVVNKYMEHAIAVIDDKELHKAVQSQILSQMAQAINYLVPLLHDDQKAAMEMKQMEMEMNMQQKQMEFEMKQQEHQMNMEMKKAELEHKAAEMQLKLQHSQQESQMKLQQQKENHEHSIVQSEESHKSKMKQQEQAAKLKQSSKPVSNKGKK